MESKVEVEMVVDFKRKRSHADLEYPSTAVNLVVRKGRDLPEPEPEPVDVHTLVKPWIRGKEFLSKNKSTNCPFVLTTSLPCISLF